MKKESDMDKILANMQKQYEKLDKELSDLRKKHPDEYRLIEALDDPVDKQKGSDEKIIKSAKRDALLAIMEARTPKEQVALAKGYLEDERIMSGIYKGGRTGRLLQKLANLPEDTAQKTKDYKKQKEGDKPGPGDEANVVKGWKM